MKADEHEAEDGPPNEHTIDEIAQRATRRYAGADVGVMWVWSEGRKMYYFRWSEGQSRHEPVDRLDSDTPRVLVAMAYSGLQAERELLEE